MNRIAHFVSVQSPLSYGEALTLSLIEYAEAHKKFAEVLRGLVFHLPRNVDRGVGAYRERDVRILVPEDADDALRRATWLLPRIEEERTPEYNRAAAILVDWAGTRREEEPKQIVVGVVQVAIPGITLGKIKRRRKVLLFVRPDVAERKDFEMSRRVSEATLGLLAGALEEAGGNVYELEPEVGDWFFGERETAFFAADEKELVRIGKELEELDVLHFTTEENGRDAVLAVSPAVNSAYAATVWNAQPII